MAAHSVPRSTRVSNPLLRIIRASCPRAVCKMRPEPYFRDDKRRHNGFLIIALSVALIGFLFVITVFLTIKPQILEKNIEKSPLLIEYVMFIVPLVFFNLFYSIFDNYYKVLFNAVIGTFLKEVLQRLLILIAVLFISLT